VFGSIIGTYCLSSFFQGGGSILCSLHFDLDALNSLSCQLVSYDPTSRPLAFVWNLLDYDKLVSHKNTHVRETFRNLTQA
jgi:hypothetical protein